ncbi:hypothetical protein ACHQM5_004546 [Ranunculus cassubicifolius]
METTVASRWLLCCLCWLLISQTYSVMLLAYIEEKLRKVRGVSLGGWLVVEAWIKHSLFEDIPNGDMLDGTEVQFQSVASHKYVTAENGGGQNVTVNTTVPGTFETFRLWRVSETQFQFRTSGDQFLSCVGQGCSISAKAEAPSINETFFIERFNNLVHIKTSNGAFLQAQSSFQLTADYLGIPGWDDNTATFEMFVVSSDYHGEFQLTNGWGDRAKDVLQTHRDTFVTEADIRFLSKHGINTLRIPVGWWIYRDPNPPAPYVAGSLEALDNAFKWAQAYDMKCIIDLHAAPDSQNGKETSSSRDGSADWAKSQEYISLTLDVIDFLASRYAKNPTLLGISLLNNPSASSVPLDILVSYYSKGYEIVRNYSSTAYVIIPQRTGQADPTELIQANIGSLNLVLEVHFYNRDNLTVNASVADNIEFVQNKRRTQLDVLNSANGPLIFVGEWVNLMTVENASREDYIKFGKAQLEVYSEASFGWAYWTLKNQVKRWDFEWNIQRSYLQTGKYQLHIILAGFVDSRWKQMLTDNVNCR